MSVVASRLFNDTLSTTVVLYLNVRQRTRSVNSKRTGENQSLTVLGSFPGNHLERQRETTKILSQDSWCPGQDSNDATPSERLSIRQLPF